MSTTNNGSPKWREVTIGGISGILLGSASTMFASNINGDSIAEDDAAIDEENAEAQNEGAENAEEGANPSIPNNGAVATSVNDSMSFNEAFAAARSELGAGGYFVWHGNVYGTYYANEWHSMSQAQQDQFSSGTSHVPHHEYASHTHSHATGTATGAGSNTAGSQQEGEEVEFEVLGVEHANIDGEHDSVIGLASVGGQAVYFIDVDGQDNEFEYMAADLNGNSRLDEDEFVDISDQHMQVSSFEQMAQVNNPGNEVEQYYANNDNLPDYVNDADTGSLA